MIELKILKVFNNNSVAAISDDLGDIILTGSGIGFQKKAGDLVDQTKIEKTYLFKDDQKKRFEQSIAEVPAVYYEIAHKIVSKAVKDLKVDFSGEIFIAISDHLSFAVKRKKENIYLPNIILNETKIIYKEEYKVGLWALNYIENKIGIRLDEDEAGYLALHLINFSLSNNANNAMKIVTLTKEVLNLIKKTMKVELEEDSIGYTRISTHLKFLAERIFRDDASSVVDTTSDIREMLKEDARLALCINRIVKLIKERYNYDLSPDEQTYLCIHIKKNTNTNN
ncbi:MAG: PRD domain-containing protein [Thomasclavelia spiroformis]|uniref:PRD domain-containing protein n=1 Tax=uncultured Thomasclavelia sp. TaxID=3025759 RepID=UPI002595262C|nr:PRD domain-containing protein [uncultured Thomasclavelia sp.]